ncbi:MAG: hypothetical protein CMO13_04885 [Thaumarchaeota archaeon]|jgi:uncharacterized membrane protein (Fun14 family)|nr:hypothetical protein [Nitrososphaerota archaeon]|tara:strand:- start:1301 stop:1606 length:306 start_codon:yes stop_codon:yes gene_type:complete
MVLGEALPIISIIIYGALGGLVAGYAFKRIAKLIVVLIALLIFAVNYLGYTELFGVNYNIVSEYIIEQTGLLSSSILTTVIVNIPLSVGFLLGFIIGIKKL